jgi:tRNA (mo5U34)-methyltransferase
LVLETIVLPGDQACAFTPPDRYARMRNVWLLPTIPELTTWLRRSGFADIDVVDQSITTVDEQRTTEWMPFESLAAALDPADPARTVEGLPAPRRAIVLANAA